MHAARTIFFPAVLAVALISGGCGGSGRPKGTPVPDPDTIRTIEGRIARHATGPELSNRDLHGRLLPVQGFMVSTLPGPVPRVPVEIRKPDGTVLGTGVTDADGRYSVDVNFGQSPATRVIVRAEARIDLPFGTAVRVLENESAPAPYSHESAPGGNPDDRVMTVDLAIDLDSGAAAYYILEPLYAGFTMARAGINAPMPDLDIHWEPGNGDESSFEVRGGRGVLTIAGGIAGDSASNRDCWDAPKVMRLMGEYLFGFFLNETAPEGLVNDALVVPSAAWREGFLDFWACISRDSPEYWDTEGIGAEGRVVRYFNLESYFDASLTPLGPDDPNVYQDSTIVGIGSAFTVAELLWDIHDPANTGDFDSIDSFPLFLTLRKARAAVPGFSYPYLFTLFDEYADDLSIRDTQLDALMIAPEDQGLTYSDNKRNWPTHVSPDHLPFGPISVGFDKTVQDTIDTTPDGGPFNDEIGFTVQRYFLVDLVQRGNLIATLTPSTDLIVDIMDLNNNVIVSGPSPQTAFNLETLRYIIRIRSANDPQTTPYDLRVRLTAP